ncbi:virion structural protein [Acaryochloris phage A-HIS2]|nr:virion structural protein [Acaryochloris phage A-HIS2]
MLNYAQIETALNTTFQEPISDLVSRDNPTLRMIKKKAVASDQIYLKFKGASDHAAGPIVDGADITFAGTERTTRQSAVLPFTTYAAKFSVAKRTLAQAASNPGLLGRLLEDEVMDAAKDLADRISLDIFGDGSVANTLVGLGAILDDANTYAGVDRSVGTNANWRGVVVDNQIAGPAAGEISTQVLDSADLAFFNANKYGLRDRSPQRRYMGMSAPGVLDRYAQLFTQIDLTDLSTAHFVDQANDSGNLGLTSMAWQGIPIMRDAQNLALTTDIAGSGRLYFLDLNRIYLANLVPSSEAQIHQIMGAQKAPTVDGLKFEIEILGNSGESVNGYVKTYLQLFTDAPKQAGVVVKNIAQS